MNTKNIPNWKKLPWNDKRVYVNGFFLNGEVKYATRDELEDYLIVLANATPGGYDPVSFRSEMERQSEVARHLLQVRLGQEFHWRILSVSIGSFVVAILSLVISFFAFSHTKERDLTTLPVTVSRF